MNSNIIYLTKKIKLPFLMVILLSYFSYHLFQGERGINAWFKINKALKINEVILKDLQREKCELESKVLLLRPDNLDADLLEERIKQVLHFAHPNELIITP